MSTQQEDCYNDINPHCDRRFSVLEDGIGRLLENQLESNGQIADMHKRLFMDNGEKSYQSFRRYTEGYMKIHLWLYAILVSGTILTTLGFVINKLLTKTP